MFTGNDPIRSATSTVAYHQGLQPNEYLRLLRDAISLLDKCVGAARGHHGDPSDKKRNASLNLLLGFGLMAMSEARALLALVSIGLERSARIHFRSLHEYAFRATPVLDDPETAHNFKIAAARETEKYARWFKLDAAQTKAATAQYLLDADPGQESKREQDALGGDMASLMRKRFGNDATYASTFGQPSLFSHGSILALYEVSEAVANRGNDFPAYLFSDGQGPELLATATMKVLELSLRLLSHFGIDVLQDWDKLRIRVDELVVRDGLTTGVP